MTIKAIDLPDSEKAVILELFGSAEAFVAWQKDVLASEIERRAANRGSAQANEVIRQAVEDTKSQMPTLFPPDPAASP